MKALLIALLISAPAAALAQDDDNDRRITVENHTGRTIYNLYGSRSSTDSWEEDILGDRVFADNTHKTINMYDGTSACRYDFKVVFSDETTMTRTNVNVCRESTLTFGPLRHGHTN